MRTLKSTCIGTLYAPWHKAMMTCTYIMKFDTVPPALSPADGNTFHTLLVGNNTTIIHNIVLNIMLA